MRGHATVSDCVPVQLRSRDSPRDTARFVFMMLEALRKMV